MDERLERACAVAWRLRNSRAVTVETISLVIVATTIPIVLTVTRYGTPLVATLQSVWAVVVLVPLLVTIGHVLAAIHDVRQYSADAPDADREGRVFAHALGRHLFTLHFLLANLFVATFLGVGHLPALVLVVVGLYAAVLFVLSAIGIRDEDLADALAAQQEA